ncbi:hypothetical protein BKH13_13710 [Actinomyces naeslundii]|uniref:DUF2637 domain-containing protein n=1 Tax=Actinomyces naeslundii TaxID=1655 RepID=A0ABX3EVF1_ACTNA|nr:DUF2637 domain-containing protein [Actinomyces naeslundii]OLO80193.1 hypothetical protein BKH13_13710 [Actinomyces naeslundii]
MSATGTGLRSWSHSWVGRISVAGTALLAIGGFVLSFAALRDLAVRVGMPADLGWIWPLLIDGMIVEATLAVVALAQRGSRAVWYAWFLLAVGAVVSVGSNGVHAMVTGHGWAGAAAASVPPVVLLATTHLTVLLMAAPDATDSTGLTGVPVGTELQPGPDGGGCTPPRGTEAPATAVDEAREQQASVSQEPAASGPSPAAPGDGELDELDGPAPTTDVTDVEAEPSDTADEEAQGEAAGELSLEEWVARREAAGQAVTGTMVAKRLGVSPSTGRRRLAALRKARQPHLRLASNE